MQAWIQTFAAAHWAAIMVAVGVWTVAATVIAARWPKPAATAPWYARLGHFILVDLPSWVATQDGKTWMGLKVSIPFVTWTMRPVETDARTKQSGMVVTGVMLVVALLGALALGVALAGCHTAGGAALGQCELSKLPVEEQALASSISSIALDPGSAVADLENLAIAVGSAQFSCVVQAVQAWLARPAPSAPPGALPVANALTLANADVRRDHAAQVLSQYLSAHPVGK